MQLESHTRIDALSQGEADRHTHTACTNDTLCAYVRVRAAVIFQQTGITGPFVKCAANTKK